MTIVPIHYNQSKPVKRFSEISSEADQMRAMIADGKFEGLHKTPFALAHCQVSERPMAFFVVAPKLVADKSFAHEIIINPEIINAPLYKKAECANLDTGEKKIMDVPNSVEYEEACFSFPFRKPKRIMRFDQIYVRYYIPGLLGLKKIERWLSGAASEIFQHEFDHTEGRNIFFEGKTVKWWDDKGARK